MLLKRAVILCLAALLLAGCTASPKPSAAPALPAIAAQSGGAIILDMNLIFTPGEELTLRNNLANVEKLFAGEQAQALLQEIGKLKIKEFLPPLPEPKAGYAWSLAGRNAMLFLNPDDITVFLKAEQKEYRFLLSRQEFSAMDGALTDRIGPLYLHAGAEGAVLNLRWLFPFDGAVRLHKWNLNVEKTVSDVQFSAIEALFDGMHLHQHTDPQPTAATGYAWGLLSQTSSVFLRGGDMELSIPGEKVNYYVLSEDDRQKLENLLDEIFIGQQPFLIEDGDTVKLDVDKLFNTYEGIGIQNDLAGDKVYFEPGQAGELRAILQPIKLRKHPDPQPADTTGYLWEIGNSAVTITVRDHEELDILVRDGDRMQQLYSFLMPESDGAALDRAIKALAPAN